MKVKELIKTLEQVDPELVVCLGDWGECYADNSEEVAEEIQVVRNGRYRCTFDGPIVKGDFLQIGKGRDD